MHLVNRSARQSWFVAGAAALAIFAGGAQAADTASVTVHYDKTTDAGQLYARLQRASARVCRRYESKELRQLRDARVCYDQALNDAVTSVGDAELTALHRDRTDMRLAQRDSNRQRRS